MRSAGNVHQDPDLSLRARAAIWAVSALLLAGLSGGCGEASGPSTSFRPIRRPPLTAAPDATPELALAPWARIEPAAGGVEVVQALRTEVRPDVGLPGSPGLLKLFHRDRKVIAVARPAGAGRLDRVRVRVEIARFDSLRFAWLRDGVVRGESTLPLFPSNVPLDYSIELPIGADRDFDRLEFDVLGEGAAAIGRIELLELAGEHRLPHPGQAPQFVKLGEDVRPAWGIAPTRPLQVAFESPADGILVVSAAIPEDLRLPGDAPILSVQIQSPSSGLRVHRYPLVEADAASSGWVWIRVPLGAPAEGARQRTTTVRFLLESNAPRDAVCAITQPQVVQFDEDAPTVLLVTSDTHRGDHAGFAHSGVNVTTPVLDGLAARGVVFTDAWSAANVTLPSHAAILTGLSPRDTGILQNTHALAAEAKTLSDAFAGAGWATVAAVSASHLDADWSGLGQGFDRMAVCRTSKRGAGETLAHLERWIADYRGRPLFVWLHLFDAHAPYAPPQPLDRSAWDPARDPYDPKLPEPDPRLVPRHLAGVRDLDYVVAQYRGELNYLDSELARLLDRSRFRDAIVAFTADHGESFGSHGVYWDHGGLYRDRLHVPLVLRWPGAPAGTRVAQRVSNTDVGRTLLDLAGLRTVEHPGTSLLARIGAPGAGEPVCSIACYGFSAAIADGDDLLILHLVEHELHNRSPDGIRKRHEVEMYDLAHDPDCQHDTSGARHERAAELRGRLVDWLRAGESLPWKRTPVGSVDVLENLAALGYAGASETGDGAALFPAVCGCGACAKFRR